jgi:hypothetical protein
MMTMPKAPVDENHLSAFSKNNIRAAWQIFQVKSVAVAHAVHKAPHYHLRPRIATTYLCHAGTSLPGSQCVQLLPSRIAMM